MRLLFVILMLLILAFSIRGNNLPDKFFGKFSLDHSDNFDAYLTAKGFNWIMRRIIMLLNIDVVFTKAGENSFNYDFLTILKDIHVKNIVFGQEMKAETLNTRLMNVWVKVKFTLRGARLYVNQGPVDPKDHDVKGIFSFKVDGDTLVLFLQAEGVVAKNYFKRQ